MRIDKEFKKLITPMSSAEFIGLEQDLKTSGCREALIVWAGHDILLDGHNRFELCQKHKIKFRIKKLSFKTRLDAKLWILRNQFHRRNLTDFQKIELFETSFKPLLAAQAKANQGKRTDLLPESSKKSKMVKPIDTHSEGAKAVGCSKATFTKACKIIREAPKRILNKVRNGDLSIDRGAKELKNYLIEREIDTRKKRKPALPEGLFDLIVIDPPWQYEQKYDSEHNRGGSPYPTMPLEEIKAIELPIAKNAAVFIWTTQAFLPYAFELLTAWGLEYKQTLVWQKPNIGLGNYFRNDVEFCLFALKGKCPPMNPLKRKSRTTIQAPSERHSEKPDCFYRLLDKLFTKCRKLDYFARKSRNGWSVFGNEVGE